MKKCGNCKNIFEDSFFSIRKYKNGKQVLRSYCKKCESLLKSNWYKKNKDLVHSRTKNHRAEIRNILWSIKDNLCCKNCGENNIYTLEFHHRDSRDKDFPLNLSWGYSKEKVLNEIEKCDILCSNCHRKIHRENDKDIVVTIDKSIIRNRNIVREIRKKSVCKECGETDDCCLDFHHLDKESKEYTISRLISHHYSEKRLLKEIEKCVIICSNCHKKIHGSKAHTGRRGRL